MLIGSDHRRRCLIYDKAAAPVNEGVVIQPIDQPDLYIPLSGLIKDLLDPTGDEDAAIGIKGDGPPIADPAIVVYRVSRQGFEPDRRPIETGIYIVDVTGFDQVSLALSIEG